MVEKIAFSTDETDKGNLKKLDRNRINESDRGSIWKLLTSREVIQALLISLSFGISLPCTDSGTDIRLSFRLFMNSFS